MGWKDYSYTASEFEHLVTKAGMTPMQSICAGTSVAADLLNLPIGRVMPGLAADLVVVKGNPVDDITLLQTQVCWVMKDGQVVRPLDK